MTRLSDQCLTQVEAALRQRIGFDPLSIGGESVRRAVRQRMVIRRIQSADHYVKTLLADHAEFDEFIEELLVPETWFFRDGQPFHFLRFFVTHRWRPGQRPDRLRVLSIPCSTGEEPYSIAMTLLALGLLSSQFQVDGADLSRRALAKAKKGVFSSSSLRGDEAAFPELCKRFLDEHEGSYVAGSQLRDTVQFLEANLVAPGCLAGQSKYHVVFCRNVLIYLDTHARRTALKNLHRLLAPNGVLYVGHVEARIVEEGSFNKFSVEFPFAFSPISPENPNDAATRAVPPTPLALPGPAEHPVRPAAKTAGTTRRELPNTTTVFRTGLGAGAEQQTASKGTPMPQRQPTHTKRSRDTAVEPTSASGELSEGHVTGALQAARQAADSGRLDEAATLCEEILAGNKTNADVLCLMGLISNARGDTAEAERLFQQTLYLAPRHYDALVHMMLLARQRGDSTAAGNFRRRVEQAGEMGG